MKYLRLILDLILLCSFAHGIGVIWNYEKESWPATLYNKPIILQGTVVNLPQEKNHALQFWFQTPQGLLQLNWYIPQPKLKPGQEWSLNAKIKPDTFQGNIGEFDYGQYLKEQGVLASGYVVAKAPATLLGFYPWKTPIQTLRFYVYEKVIATTNGLSMQGILIALILGDKTLLNPLQWQVFSESGTSYFMVISGLHIVLFAMMGGMVARYFWCLIPRAPLKVPAQKIGLLVGLGFGLIYSILAGFSVPTQRALWMLWLIGIAKLFLERIHPMILLLSAFIIVILWDPLSLKSIAFWLSFIAVFFLIYTMSSRYRKFNKWEEWIYPQWMMYVVLMPPLIYVFHEFSLISLGTNFLAMLFMMLAVIPLALLGGLFIFISPSLGHLFFVFSNKIMSWLWILLKWGVSNSQILLHLPQPSLFKVILSLIGCLLLFAPRGIPGKFAGLLMILTLIFPKPLLKSNELKITTLMLSEGNVKIFETKNDLIVEQNVIHLREAKSAIHTLIEPYLQTRGETKITLWIVNGIKNYHALQSLENTWQTTQIQKIMLPHLPKTYDSNLEIYSPPARLEDKNCLMGYSL